MLGFSMVEMRCTVLMIDACKCLVTERWQTAHLMCRVPAPQVLTEVPSHFRSMSQDSLEEIDTFRVVA